MSQQALIACDIVAVLILVFGLYFPRHRRRDMIVAILGVNVGVLAVATVLSKAEVSAGLGLGLFGLLSIIRLRSQELDQEEIVYYFSALTLGLAGGIPVDPAWISPVLMAGILLALFIGDHPKMFPDHRTQVVTLDAAYTDETQLREQVEQLLHCRVHRMKVRRVNLVNDTTIVDVRYSLLEESTA